MISFLMNMSLVSWSLNSLDIILQSKALFLHVICTELRMKLQHFRDWNLRYAAFVMIS